MVQNDSITANGSAADRPSPLVESAPITENHADDEDSALALLKCLDLSLEVIEQLSKGSVAANSRKVKLAIVRHPKTPRYVSLALLRKLFTFDLMRVALTLAVAR